MTRRPQVLVVAGYFDWFSGYQEVGLVRALQKVADVRVLAGDQVYPGFSDAHLAHLGIPRQYEPGRRIEQGVEILRLPSRHVRSMVFARGAARAVDHARADLVVQVMPGQALPVAATAARDRAPRVALYGDNSAMYATLGPTARAAKFAVFMATKGAAYRAVNQRATRTYGYTPQTLERLAPTVPAARPMQLLPLAFDDTVFAVDAAVRRAARAELGVRDDEFLVLAPGKVQSQKRYIDLVHAVDAARLPNVRLVFVGADTSAASEDLRRAVAISSAAATTTVLPFVDAARMNQLFNAADLGVWPAMPAITIQQAMGTGLRVVIPENDLVGHLLTTEESGTFIPQQGELSTALADVVRSAATHAPDSSDTRARRALDNGWLSTTALANRVLECLA